MMCYECNIQLIDKHREGDRRALEDIFKLNLPLVLSVSKPYFNRGIEKEDIIQTGCLGLMKAVLNYDKEYDTQFSTYASYLIKGEIRRQIRDDWPIKVSRSTKAKARDIYYARQELSRELMRDPTTEEISRHTGLGTEEIAYAVDAARRPQYLHGVIYEDGGTPVSLIDKMSKETADGADMFDEISLKMARDSLKGNLREVIQMRYFDDMTQSQVAEVIGVSQVQVSRLEMKARRILRRKLT
ncbi:MAG: sporulation sigma factor SigF [Firmicutes bacterium]|nr:sporulation sigma factor SigF [Bacillota bacterium]